VEADGESQVSAGVGSTGSLDRINEDFNRSTKARETGFMGNVSEVSWLHRLQNKLDSQPAPAVSGPETDGLVPNQRVSAHASQPAMDEGVAGSTYHCDDYSIIAPDQVEMFELPPRHIAEFLLHTYIESVHPTFPMIGKLNFLSQVQNFFNNEQSTPGRCWLAILNLIFAIAAKYSHLVQADLRGDERDHLIYFTRARLLGMDSESILALPDLQRVQTAGLMSFYLMSVNQINRYVMDDGLCNANADASLGHGQCVAWQCGTVWLLVCISAMKTLDFPILPRRSGTEYGGPSMDWNALLGS
jgi:hypothetical protein